MSFLEVKDVEYYYQDGGNVRTILKDVNYQFEKGVFYAIVGKSGSGKTTLLSLLSALDVPQKGGVLYEGQGIQAIGASSYRRNKLGIVFQSFNLITYLTPLENLQVAMSITDNDLPQDQVAVAYNLLDYIGVTRDKANRLVTQLSGGEQQRVAIARALSTNVELILADEPTGNLDEAMEKEIINIFKRLAHEHNRCVVVVTHSDEVAKQADVVLRLDGGKLV